MTESPAAQRGSTQNRHSAGPPALRNHPTLKSSSWEISSTRSAPPLLPATPPMWTTAAPSAPAETEGKPLCFNHVGRFCRFLNNPSRSISLKLLSCFLLLHLRSNQHIRRWNNNILLQIKHQSDTAHLEIQPHRDHRDSHRDGWRLHGVRQLEETREERVPVWWPPVTTSVFISGGNIHLWAQRWRGNIRNRHKADLQPTARWDPPC